MAEEKLERANFYGAEKIISGRGGAAGGSGGGGLGVTGGAYVPAEGGITTTNRWLRFDFNDPNHKSLVILGGTSFTIGENIVTIDETTSYNLSDYTSEEGADYYVFINADGRVVCSTLRTQPDGYMFIGQFHTLCVDVGDNVTEIVAGPTGSSVGDTVTLQNYFKERDLDFYNFYSKEILAVNDGTPYAAVTIDHPLSGFKAGDILPESIWCLNWHPVSKSWDGMVWCNGANCCVDIYFESGAIESFNVKSEYGAVPLHAACITGCDTGLKSNKRLVGINEFPSIAEGSPNRTYVNTFDNICGGHISKNGKRMISFIGCEDCCGFLHSTTSVITLYSNDNVAYTPDGRGLFGIQMDLEATIRLGGDYSQANTQCGVWYVGGLELTGCDPYGGLRYVCDITIV